MSACYQVEFIYGGPALWFGIAAVLLLFVSFLVLWGGWVRGVVAALVQFQSAGKVLTHAVTMFPSGDVRRELIPVLAVIATHVAFKRITEPVTAHVDGVHDMI